jgi:HD-like signal output (HDOD) protein/CheY-like chemotaxis protein
MSESARQHILFVDDDPWILRAIEREMRAYSDRWTISTAIGGERAMQLLSERPFDILVTDMSMPVIDGAALLHHVREHYPSMVRIVLSGHAELEHAVRSVPFAHQRLLKPWRGDELAKTLDRASRLRELVGDDLIRRCISQVGSLPSSTATYARLSAALDAPNASFASVAAVAESDMAMSAKLLQLANSAFVGANRTVTRMTDAVRTVGLSTIRQYLLSPYLNVFEMFTPGAGEAGQRFTHLGAHAVLTANLTAGLAKTEELRGPAFVTGILHDIGSLVLLTRMPEVARELAEESRAKDCGVEALELRRFGVTHAEIGGYLLGLWGLPADICGAVSRHHESGAGSEPGELALTLRVANWLAREHEARRAAKIIDPGVLVLEHDETLLETFGVARDIPRLLALADECAARSSPRAIER